MADDRKTWRKNLPADFDGRFGKEFDDELNIKIIVQVAVGLLAICALTFVGTWGLLRWFGARAAAAQPAPSAVAEANVVYAPPGPQLQAHPEQEMEALRHEMQAQLNGYGWVDEVAGTVHIPVEQAMALLVEKAGSAASQDAASQDAVSPGTVSQDAVGDDAMLAPGEASGRTTVADPSDETAGAHDEGGHR